MPRAPRYFPHTPVGADTPRPLGRSVLRAVRFEETDPMGLVWHGRYPGYCEDARVMLGDSLGIGYHDFYAAGVLIPVTRLEMNYKAPLRYGDTVCITARLHWTDAARMLIDYTIARDGVLCFSGASVQHFTTLGGELRLIKPPFYEAFCARWAAGNLPEDLPDFTCFSHQTRAGAAS